MYQLHIHHQQNKQVIQLSDYFLVGKSSSNHYVVDDPDIGDRHFRIEKKKGQFLIRDLMSPTGTFVNGVEILEAKLQIGDCIRIGKNTELHFQNESHENTQTSSLSSRNRIWNEQLKTLSFAAASDFPVLLLAESGSGKEVLASEIHQKSQRRQAPLVSINCSALSESLIESELFGHVKGSFTGATEDRKGAFESARGGTLFLDEIGDLPLNLQPKLLRALENNEIRPVGSDKTKQTDVRVIAATHQNLREKVSSGQFRADLFYRLNVIQFTPPPLRHRLEDFETLTYQFCREYKVRLSHEAIQAMKEYNWPGNIRELKNTVAKISVLYPHQHIQKEQIQACLVTTPSPADDNVINFQQTARKRSRIQKIERELIVEKLIEHQGNQRRTASDLGIPKSTLHDRIRSYGINIKRLVQSSMVQPTALSSSI